MNWSRALFTGVAFVFVQIWLLNGEVVALENKAEEKKMSQTEALQEKAQESVNRIPAENRKVMAAAIKELIESGIEKSVVKKGEKIPEFVLPNSKGEKVSLKLLLEDGPVIMVFYRGGWCPYCNINLHYLQKELPEIEKQGAKIVAISPETPDNSLSTKEKNSLKFEVLSDSGNSYARKLGLVFKLPPELVSLYKNFGIDLEKANGNSSNELPLSATFVVDKSGKIFYRYVDADYKKRMDPSDIVVKLKELNQSKEACCK